MSTTNTHQAFNLLKYTFIVLPIAAGLDKFLNLLTDWTDYIAPSVADMLPFSAATFMMIVGVIEIAAGLIVIKAPKIGGYIVSAWLVLVAVSLLIAGYADVAVRDLVIALSAFAMTKMAKA